MVYLCFFFGSVLTVHIFNCTRFLFFLCRLKDKYHPTNLLTVIERWGHFIQEVIDWIN